MIRAASVAGRRVPHPMLAEVAGSRRSTPRPWRFGQPSRAMCSYPSAPRIGPGYAFRHALLGEAVYDDLLPGERVRLHAGYVAALRSLGGTAAELARHARAAHDVPTAVKASIEAGDEAFAVGGPEEAARHYEVALELLAEPGSDGQRHRPG